MKKEIILLLSTLAVSVTIFSHDVIALPELLTLDYCVQRALEANYSLAIQKESVEKSSNAVLGSWSDFMPGASTRFSWSRSDQERYSIGESGPIVSRDYYSTGLSINQTLFAGGRNLLDLKSSYVQQEMANNNYSNSKLEIIYRTKSAYYYAVSAERASKNASEAHERALDQMRLVAHRDSLGLADPTEVSQMRVNLAQTELSTIQAKNTARKALETLLALLAIPLDTEIELSDEFGPISENLLLETYLENAFANSPDVRNAELEIKRTRLSRMASWSSYLPGVSASFGYNWSGAQFPSSFRRFDEEASYSYGISANWTLFSGTTRVASIRNSNSACREAEIRLAQTKQNIEVSVRNAFRTMVESTARKKLAEVALEDAILNSTLFREKYSLGNCTLLELLQAELNLQKAKAEVISAELNYRISVAELDKLSGAWR